MSRRARQDKFLVPKKCEQCDAKIYQGDYFAALAHVEGLAPVPSKYRGTFLCMRCLKETRANVLAASQQLCRFEVMRKLADG